MARELSEKEKRVIELACQGITSQEISGHMAISKRTVDFHLYNIYNKLGVKNRIQAINEWKRKEAAR